MTLKRLSCLALPLLFLASQGHAEDLKFKLVNKSSGVLIRFFTSPVGVDDWEEDVFGNQVLNPGEKITLTIADGRRVCDYDMRMEFKDGEVLEDEQNLCELGEYTITDD
ncbi:hypothetical protein ACQ3G6_08755 [Allorhizobium undicola]|uniref:hypothetical protein n=1 Tax=Allorhizobium undicola TaxID=78527 RepID=UPI00047FAE79|nr:hypothetical protein [Allorhizobium undicola]